MFGLRAVHGPTSEILFLSIIEGDGLVSKW